MNFDVVTKMTHIDLEISNPCNEKCLHCYRTCTQTRKGFLSCSDARSVLGEAKELGATSCLITGGEALLNSEWKEIVSCADSLGFRFSLFTNGTLMTKDDVAFLATKSHLKEVQFSLYSLDEQVHDAITCVKGSCAKTKNAIQMCREAKIPVFISCPAMQQNKHTLAPLMRWADGEGIGSCVDLFIFGTSDYSKSNLKIQLTKRDLKKFFKITQENNGELSYIWGKDDTPKNTGTELFYGGATSSLLVSGDGNIYPMIVWYKKLGNIKDCSLKDVFYNNELLQEIRTIKAVDIKACKKCKLLEHCHFCPAPHLTANNGELYKVSKQVCKHEKLIANFFAKSARKR